MRLAGPGEVLLDAEVELEPAAAEPAAAPAGQPGWLGDLGQAEHVTPELAARLLSAGRDRELNVVQPGDLYTFRRCCSIACDREPLPCVMRSIVARPVGSVSAMPVHASAGADARPRTDRVVDRPVRARAPSRRCARPTCLASAAVRQAGRAAGRSAGRSRSAPGEPGWRSSRPVRSLSVYWPVLFYVRAFQTVVLLLAVPLFLMLGRPLSLVIAAAPRSARASRRRSTGRVARVLTFPAITGLVLVLTPFVLYFSPWYAAGFHSFAVRELTYLALVLPGLVFFWTLLRVDPVPRQYPYLVALWVTAAEVVGDAALGLSVIVDRNLIAGSYYHALARPWGPSLAADQVLGGGALWMLGDIIGLPFLAAILIAMIREDESEARSSTPNWTRPRRRARPIQPARTQQKPAVVGDDPRFAGRFAPVEPKPARSGSVAAADPERPAGGRRQSRRSDELVRLQAAPGRHVGLRRRVVGEHLDDLADRNLADPLGQHDDRQRAFLAERVDRERWGTTGSASPDARLPVEQR